MRALFSGNLVKGMKLVGVYSETEAEQIAIHLAPEASATSLMDCEHQEQFQLLPLVEPAAASIYGEISHHACVILVSGSLTRGIRAVGPYPDRDTAFNNAVALTFGSKSSNFFPVEIEPEYESLRQKLEVLLA